MKAALIGLALAVSTACGSNTIIASQGPTSQHGPLLLRNIEFHANDSIVPLSADAQEGYLVVPESRVRRTEQTVTIRFVRLPSTSAAPGPPIVYLAGGPGGSGVLSAAGDRFPLFMKLRQAGDVIALDQRGVFGTEPSTSCPGAWNYPLDRPANAADLQAALTPFLMSCYKQMASTIDPSSFNTRESAGDLDDLRRALGAETISVWGISYGTHLALAYLRQYPQRVHRAVLAGVEGPNDTYKLPASIDRVLRDVHAQMASVPRVRQALPDFVGALRQAIADLERAPRRVSVIEPRTRQRHEVVVGAADLQAAVLSSLGERQDIEGLPRRLVPILRGDVSMLALRSLRNRLEIREDIMPLGMDCASGATKARLDAIASQASSAILGDVANAMLRARCAAWPVVDLGDGFRAPGESNVPTLFISGSLDARTPPSNAEEVLKGFANGHHLVIERGSHDDDLFLSSPHIGEAILQHLQGRQVTIRRIELPELRFR